MKLDPRTKLIMVMLLTTLGVLAIDLGYLFIVFLISLAFCLILNADLIMAIKRLRHLISVIVFIAIVQSLAVRQGRPLVYIGNFYILTLGGLINGGEFALRMMIIVLASLIVAGSSSSEMADGLIKMKIPYELAFMTIIALRFLPIFREEFSSRLNAIALKGIDLKRQGVIKKIKIYSYLIMPTVSGSILKSKRLSKSIEARGFRAYPQRTMYRELKLSRLDYVIMSLIVVFFISFLVIMYSLGGLL
ncbi:MAG: energy-coupling factor transporter transmembrane component T [Bacillota bacterium]|jgi:energy-coupling factor transport system permease protein|nr:energy-coupling factor transporter transmembrane component T [Bacillota bacterium]HHU43984.1 energy-coupling factor transporter transmembrane protein EcfT [Clostridiales bacterium]